MKQIIKFIQTLQSGKVEFNNLTSTFDLKTALSKTKENIYFLTGIAEGVEGRASDKDIATKKYFVIDVDLYNNYKEEHGQELDIPIKEIAEQMICELEHISDEFLGWAYVIFSGRGLHFYYLVDEKEYEPEIYSLAVKEIYKKWNELWGFKVYFADNACSNIARIMRLPGTYNQKNSAKCEIIAEKETVSDFDLEKIGQERLLEIQEEREANRKEVEQKLLKYKNGENELYNKINSIPAYEIAQLLLPQFKYDGRRNFRNNKGGFTAYYYNESFNTIHNGGSRHFNFGDSNSGFSNFSMIKNHKGLDNAETFLFFKKLLGV